MSSDYPLDGHRTDAIELCVSDDAATARGILRGQRDRLELRDTFVFGLLTGDEGGRLNDEK